nr:hypothetical protein [Endozoicomonas sp.]
MHGFIGIDRWRLGRANASPNKTICIFGEIVGAHSVRPNLPVKRIETMYWLFVYSKIGMVGGQRLLVSQGWSKYLRRWGYYGRCKVCYDSTLFRGRLFYPLCRSQWLTPVIVMAGVAEL